MWESQLSKKLKEWPEKNWNSKVSVIIWDHELPHCFWNTWLHLVVSLLGTTLRGKQSLDNLELLWELTVKALIKLQKKKKKKEKTIWILYIFMIYPYESMGSLISVNYGFLCLPKQERRNYYLLFMDAKFRKASTMMCSLCTVCVVILI